MKKSNIIRLSIIVLLWLLVCVWYVDMLIKTDSGLNLRTLFPIIASGIIIIVPLYKKYKKDTDNGQTNGK